MFIAIQIRRYFKNSRDIPHHTLWSQLSQLIRNKPETWLSSSMEFYAILPLTQLSCFMPKTCPITRAHPFKPWKQKNSKPARFRCQKMYVPGFGEASPEKKAAKNMHNFFTYIAVRIVGAQLESYNTEAHKDLMEFLDKNSLNDGDKFCAALMRESPRHKGLAMRILEVRSSYCKKDFEWDNLQRLASQMADESNTRLMRDYVLETSHEPKSDK